MAIPLKIKGVLVSVGDAESLRAVVLPVAWTGKPFTDARAAVLSFARVLLAVCRAPAPAEKPLAACCTATKAGKPKAKACPECGRSFVEKPKRTPDAQPDDLLDAIWRADVDGWTDALPRWARPSDCNDTELGGWEFFRGVPADADVVEIDRFDRLFNDIGTGRAEFSVLHVGKRATRASAHGEVTSDEIEESEAGDDAR